MLASRPTRALAVASHMPMRNSMLIPMSNAMPTPVPIRPSTHILQHHALQRHALQQHALQQHALQQHALQRHTHEHRHMARALPATVLDGGCLPCVPPQLGFSSASLPNCHHPTLGYPMLQESGLARERASLLRPSPVTGSGRRWRAGQLQLAAARASAAAATSPDGRSAAAAAALAAALAAKAADASSPPAAPALQGRAATTASIPWSHIAQCGMRWLPPHTSSLHAHAHAHVASRRRTTVRATAAADGDPAAAANASSSPAAPSKESKAAAAGVSPTPLAVLVAPVVHGFGRGSRQMGVPTANMCPDALQDEVETMQHGVYFGWAQLPGRSIAVHKMVMNLGQRPSFADGDGISVELHLLSSFENDFYGEEMRAVVLGFLRPEKRFPSLDALLHQIHADIQIASDILDTHTALAHKHNPIFR